MMRFSRKRKFTGPVKTVVVQVSIENYQKLDNIAGDDSFGRTIETLISEEHRRRLANTIKSCTAYGAVTNSTPN